MKNKKNIMIDDEIWKEIKKTAIDLGKTVSEFIEMLYISWKERQK